MFFRNSMFNALGIWSIIAGSTFAQNASQPNIVFIMTDDQDLHMNSMEFMPYVRQHIADHGTTFTNHFCTVSLCCPSRVSLLTGKAAHNTKVTDVAPPYGYACLFQNVSVILLISHLSGYPKFISENWNDRYLPVWLQDAGYNTYYTGKLMNSHNTGNYDNPYPNGWTGHVRLQLRDQIEPRRIRQELTKRTGFPPRARHLQIYRSNISA